MKTAETEAPAAQTRHPEPAAPERAGGGSVHLPGVAVAAAAAAGGALPRGPAGAAALVRLQKTVGNAQVQRLLARRAAASAEGGPVSDEVADSIASARGAGAGLGEGVRDEMEEAFGADFASVRVHTDARADALSRSLGARAFTTGADVFFRAGEFSPSSPGGRRLLAHELTHVVQQGASPAPVQRALEVGPADDEHEREAERAADAVAAGGAFAGAGAGAPSAGVSRRVQRDPDPAAPAPEKPEEQEAVLAEGEDFRWFGAQNSPRLAIRTRWLTGKRVAYGTSQLTGASHPAVMGAIVGALIDFLRWPAANRDEILKGIRLISLEIPARQWAKPEVHANLGSSVFVLVGLPPTAPVQAFPRAGGYDVYADLRTLYPRGADARAMEAAKPGIAEAMARALEEAVGGPIRADLRPRLITALVKSIPSARQTWVEPVREKDLNRAFGEAVWSSVVERRGKGSGGAVLKVPGGGYQLPEGLPAAERVALERILRDLFGIPADGPVAGPVRPVTPLDVETLLAIDKLPNRQAVVDAFREARSAGGAAGTTQSLSELVETVKAQIDRKRAAKALGHELPEPSDDAAPPVAARPVRGKIINASGALVPGMQGRFHFEQTDAVDWLRVPHVSIEWYASRRRPDGTMEEIGTDTTNYIEVRGESLINERTFEVTFDATGIYEIHAFVSHNFYFPAHFTIPVEVLAETRRLEQLEKDTGGGAFGKAGPAKEHRFYHATAEDLATGMVMGLPLGVYALLEDRNQVGTRAEGTLSDEAFGTPGGSVALARRALQSEIARVGRLADDFRKQGADQHADVIEWAEERKKRLQEELDRLKATQEAPGTVPVMVQGHYVTRRPGMKSGALRLAAWFTHTPGGDGQPGTYHAHLQDHSEMVRTEVSRFTADGTDWDRVMEKLFFELSRTYPNGTMSFAYQKFQGPTPTKELVRLERVTDTLLGDVRDVVFSDAASFVVNIAAAVLTCFPPTAPIGIGISIAYNGANSALGMADAARSGTVKGTHFVDIGMVALDAIPLLGKGARAVKAGSTAYRLVNAAQYAGMLYAFTEGSFQQIEGLRDGQISELAGLQDEIRILEATNPSDPTLREKRLRAVELRESIRAVAADVFATAAATQGVTLLAQHAATRLAQHHLGGGAEGAPRPAGEEGATPKPGDEGAAKPGEEPGRAWDAGSAVQGRARPAGDAALAAKLPDDIRGRIAVHRGPPPEAHEVRVHYETDRLGLIKEVYVRAGPDATPEAVAMHASTIRLMEEYRGFSGAARILWERLKALLGRRGAVVPGSSLFEAALEVEKLPRIIAERAAQLQASGLDPEVQADLRADLEHLKSELERHKRTVDQAIEEEGVGFVAQTVPATNAKAIAAGWPKLEGENAAPGHYYYEPYPGRFELRRWAHSKADPKRLEWDPEKKKWKVVDRPEGARSFSSFVEAQKGSFPDPGSHARLEGVVAKRFGAGDLDAGGVSLARRWGASLEALHAAAGGGDKGDALLGSVLAHLGPVPTDAGYGKFRRAVRQAIVDAALAQPHPPGQADQRVIKLRELIATLPDQRSQGETFTQFRERLAAVSGSPIDYVAPVRPASVDLPEGRHADGNIQITRQETGAPAPGSYLAEDKSGAAAFDPDQAAFYSRQIAAGAGTIKTLDGKSYSGIIYVFDNETAARAALNTIRGLHPNIRVAAFDDSGGFVWLR